jgi:hypothetical protein
MPLSIGRSWIARAASTTSGRSRSSRNAASSGMARLRIASSTAIRTAGERWPASATSCSRRAQPARPITAAWRR